MSFFFSFPFLIVVCAAIVFCCTGNNVTDRLALLQFKAGITHDPLGVMRSWNDSLHFCQWNGVTCGRKHFRVTNLTLDSSELSGTLSPFVGNLTLLRGLELQNNDMGEIIPPEIGRLHKLQYLFLNDNSFQGGIPSNISGCSNLIKLILNDNNLSGAILPEIGTLPDLQYLDLANNKLTGIIPPSLANLTSISTLYIPFNNLLGTIPYGLGKLEKLTQIRLTGNKFSGTIPLSIYNISSLEVLDLGFNQLEGRLPSNLGNMLPNLKSFRVGTNNFTGSIPDSISNSSNLEYFELGNNSFQGQVPYLKKLKSLELFDISHNNLGSGQVTDLNFLSSLANATQLHRFDIGSNNFGGIFPSVICNFSYLTILAAEQNKISGQIPTCIENLASLEYLLLGQNNFSGAIPSILGKLINLGYLDLEKNLLSGFIPPSLGNLTNLNILSLSTNRLQGHIPSTLGNYKYLQRLDLSQNNLSGGITFQLFSILGLVVLNLSNNPLGGSLPGQVEELKNINVLDVSSTMLIGDIPSTLGACVALEYIYMSGNFIYGLIPLTLSSLRGLEKLDLSHNRLSGKIPSFLADFPLRMLDLSYNNLEGEVPFGGVFSNPSQLSVDGNSRLCGGLYDLKFPPCKKNRKHNKWSYIIASLLAYDGLLLLAGFISLYSFCNKRKMKEPETELGTSSLPNLSYQALHKATNGFSPENVLGKGAFGVVYMGNFNKDQTIFAIKVFNLAHRGATKTFNTECQVLKNVRHRNILKVVTVCSSTDYRGNDFKALVYEYMVNGSLEDWLYQKPTDNANGRGDTPRILNLLERLNVAVDVAFALEHLHHRNSRNGEAILHGDLKPSNVLFDDGMVAHIGDFGLAKFIFNDKRANQSSSFGIGGTVGYSPPEYGMGNKLSTYGDVYSFGILLLEMLTGRRPTDDMFKEGLNLHGFVEAALPNHLMDIVDKSVVKDIVGEETNTLDYSPLLRNKDSILVVLETLTSVFEIALSCSNESPKERVDMSDVSGKMSSIRNKLLGTHLGRQRRNLRV